MDGTIFSVLNTPRDHISAFYMSPNENNSLKSDIQTNRLSPEKSMTMKLLQM